MNAPRPAGPPVTPRSGEPPGRGPLAAARDWAFRDRRTGAITVAQWPNPPLWLFLGLSGLAWAGEALAPAALGPAIPWIRGAAALALVWWAGDEILRGVNPWRRALGAAVLLGYAALRLWP
ncbi:hypothetical protein Q8W71_14505 [Methylobacterium sp. NEAU 140]|uniref:hypothetical protein n=1 Tax=Methylobacterium sp. NEAU 140 TaxID=3064945 RepID=UPI002736EC55|nr:hypothetical protein [Methylobacterium sp. NEAU 140]MDP4023843.1 hypothetical protein [Methylobacterium sp. NEAU 140]